MSDQPPFDAGRARRWFAVELNNLAWDLIESAGPLGEAEIDRMIHAAHASCYFWLEAGDLLNHLRAENLVAVAYIKARRAEPAVKHAEKCLALSEQAGPKQTDFDRVMAMGCAAAAYKLAENADLAAQWGARVRAAFDGLTDADERAVFDRVYGRP